MSIADVSEKSVTDLASLSGRVAVITGGAQGLGRAIADRLAEAGARVLIGDLNGEKAQAAAYEIASARGADVIATRLDVCDGYSVRTTAELARDKLGSVDIWVNNAGVFPIVRFMYLEDRLLDQVLQVNLRGVFTGAREAARQMIGAGRGGVILNIASVAGFVARSPGVSAYVASKHGVRGLTRQLAIELAPHHIRVLGIAPAFCTTEGTLSALSQEIRSQLTSRLGRVGVPDDIARVALFCVSDMALFLTGSTLLVDAGEIA